ncbi:MAG: hypothetical protein HQ567_13850 [Candidatus Nealsonbacteria bacterium]|nr:hypothetical protein [Candidatus Nealsonbacteria bacterium]
MEKQVSMALSDRLRAARIEGLYRQFIEASEKYATLYHVAIRSDEQHLGKIIQRSYYLDEASYAKLLEALGGNKDAMTFYVNDGASDGQWNVSLVRGGSRKPKGVLSVDTHRLHIDSALWNGCYLDTRHSFLHDSEHEGISLFKTLAEEASGVFTDLCESAAGRQNIQGDAFSCQRMWLELLYQQIGNAPVKIGQCFFQSSRTSDDKNEEANNGSFAVEVPEEVGLPLPDNRKELSPVLATGLPWNLFSASAHAVEKLTGGAWTDSSVPVSPQRLIGPAGVSEPATEALASGGSTVTDAESGRSLPETCKLPPPINEGIIADTIDAAPVASRADALTAAIETFNEWLELAEPDIMRVMRHQQRETLRRHYAPGSVQKTAERIRMYLGTTDTAASKTEAVGPSASNGGPTAYVEYPGQDLNL